ncbi:RNA recognition motif domain-containing protein [Apibacter adventoris]|uniref:RNA-binding protein n=1 Tax=Apibacter adventoris TaxID=1679466 RepID=A0A2S8A8A2_9FLAO|nr:RNA-binding protein [Apibacter adventoris]PQL90799.1 RNA-binding protein [Apibacter adventoris]PQL94501.1 RNA-binding protein [Apibacter adventoris]
MNIFISNLNYRLTSDDLQDLFSKYGEVQSAKIIQDRETGRSRGFGFVEMADDEANKAIEELNQKEFDGKVINVSQAREREERPRNNFRRNY